MEKLELLAPAQNYETAIAAINCGADAVYIGASKFGARVNAKNSIDDIKRVCDYAHLFNVKVYVTLNTILSELLGHLICVVYLLLGYLSRRHEVLKDCVRVVCHIRWDIHASLHQKSEGIVFERLEHLHNHHRIIHLFPSF